MHDPMALATDCLLGVAAFVFSARLWRVHRPWAVAFVFTGIAAVLGGLFHALAPGAWLLWKVVVFSVGIASFFLLAGSGGRVLRVFATMKLVVYFAWMATHNEFVWVIADYGVTLLLLGVLHLARRSPATRWVLMSIGASIAGALVQQFRLTVHPYWFDFNDLYHVVQIIALWMLYRGGALHDAPPSGAAAQAY